MKTPKTDTSKESDSRWTKVTACFEKNITWILIVIFLVILVILLGRMFYAPWFCIFDHFLGAKESAEFSAKYQTIRTLALGLLGITVLLGLAFTRKRARADEKMAEAQSDANEVQLQRNETQLLANQNMIFNEAMKNLSAELAFTRLGGIYALYELSESKSGRFGNIVEILCAHLRETTQQEIYQAKNNNKPSNEIQSLLNILTKINARHQKKSPEKLLDLSNAYLCGANLNRASLQYADLSRTQMQHALLRDAKMQHVILNEAEMQHAVLSRAQMYKAKLQLTQMQGTDLSGAQMLFANLSSAQMQGSKLINSQMQYATLTNAQMQGADLSFVQMQRADLSLTQMQGSTLLATNMKGATVTLKHKRPIFRRVEVGLKIDKDTLLENFIWSGEKELGDIDNIENKLKVLVQEKKLSETTADEIINKMSSHKGQPPNDTPLGLGQIITGTLTNEMADKIIKDHEEAMTSTLKPKRFHE